MLNSDLEIIELSPQITVLKQFPDLGGGGVPVDFVSV